MKFSWSEWRVDWKEKLLMVFLGLATYFALWAILKIGVSCE